MTETQAKPADCRPVHIKPPPQIEPSACPYTFHGKNIAELSRGGLRRLARDKGIPFRGDTKEDLYESVGVHLHRIAWPAERDLSKLKKADRK